MNSARDNYGNFAKYAPPLVANGKVYVATFSDQVAVYGLLSSGTSAAATPTFSPAAGTYSGAQSVTVLDTTPGAVIHYTTNGQTPTTSSATFNPSTPIAVSASETIEAIAVASGYTTSAVGSAAYTIGGSGTTVVNDPTGFSSSTGLSLVAGASLAGGALELTDGAGEEARAVWYATPVNVQNFTTDFNFQITPASPYTADGFTFTLQNAAAGVQAVGSGGGNLGYTGIGSSVAVKFDLYSNAGEGTDSTGFYTDGAAPTVPAVDMTASGVNLHSGDILHAHITYNGTTLTLTLTDTVTNASFTTSTAINIPSTVGGNTAYAGFTAGDWSQTATQEILNWTYVVNSSSGSSAAATPTFSPAAGTYSGAQSVTVLDTTPGAVIHYTTNGQTPTTSSATFNPSTPIAVSASETIEAIAVASGYTTSAVGSAAYTIGGSGTTVVNDPTGFSSSTGLSLVAGASLAGGALELTDGAGEEARAVWYATPVNVQNFTTDFNFQITPASPYTADGFTFTLQNAAAGVQAVGSGGGNLGYTGIGSSVAVKFDLYSNAGEGTDSTGFYTDGAAPTVPAVDMTASGVNLHSGDILHAHITYNGTTLTLTLTDTVTNASFTTSTAINIPSTVGGNTAYAGFTAGDWSQTATQEILNWTYVVNSSSGSSAAATPTFSPAAGTYSGAQSVTVLDTTPGAVIHYTTNGQTPTTSSATFNPSTPIAVSASETIEAIAVASGYTTSAVGSAVYTISGTSAAATPTFSPAAGTYSGAQSVTVLDTTPGAVIHYTTNGQTPTTSSATFNPSTPIAVSASETIEAIAVASGYTTSAVGSAAYTIGGSGTTVVNDPTGFSSSTGLSLVAGASLAGGALELTDGAGEEARAVWYATPVNVQNFTTDFNFQITPASPYTADGFTFTLQNAAAGVQAVGSGGGNLGYTGIGSSVAVKFDLYSNAGEGTDSTGFYTDGAAPTVPAVDMTASGVNLHSGDILHAHITYNGTTLTLLLTDTVTNASFTTSMAINIPGTVGGNTAYAGFTAGDWSQTATQEILNWTYVVN